MVGVVVAVRWATVRTSRARGPGAARRPRSSRRPGDGSVEDLVIRQATTKQLTEVVRTRARKKLKRTLGR